MGLKTDAKFHLFLFLSTLTMIGVVDKKGSENILERWLLSGILETIQAPKDICGRKVKPLGKPHRVKC